ncbi:Fur family transcriptional regulator [Aliikangiella sp. IMCC44359]|uniref:Fur family transcriptional regulator n=1 Tax=Aliikangiella sp. IMCC44359 TaxID=3459125 RepID=UPI00403A81C9
MSRSNINQSISKAESICQETGVKLTVKRKNVLTILLHSNLPLSAYELAEEYKVHFEESLPTMSVYRMLDFLTQENLAHKLASTNKYVSCSHIACEHQHEIPQFLICDQCQSVSEIGVKKEIIKALNQSVKKVNFSLSSQQLELHGICEVCQKKASKK